MLASLPVCLLLKQPKKAGDNTATAVHVAGNERERLRGLASRGCFIISRLIWDTAGNPHTHIVAGDFVVVSSCFAGLFFLFVCFLHWSFCTPLLWVWVKSRSTLRNSFFNSIANTGGVLCCSRTDHKKSARGTWRGKKGEIEKSTQLVKNSRKFL